MLYRMCKIRDSKANAKFFEYFTNNFTVSHVDMILSLLDYFYLLLVAL